MQYALPLNSSRSSVPNIMITNSGSQRFDLYSGPFTKNDQLTSSPFTDSFLYIPNVTLSVASQVLPALNNAGANERRELAEDAAYARGEVDMRFRRWLEEMDRRTDGPARRAAHNLTLGYVTSDVRISPRFRTCARSPSWISRSPAPASATTPSTPLW